MTPLTPDSLALLFTAEAQESTVDDGGDSRSNVLLESTFVIGLPD